MINKNILLLPYFFCVFFPFVNFIPSMPFETAPYAGAYSVFLLSAYYALNKKVYIKRVHLCILLMMTLFLVYYRYDVGLEMWYIARAVRLFFAIGLGAAVFAVAYLYIEQIMRSYKIWILFIFVWIIVGILQKTPFHTRVDAILDVIMSRSVSAYERGRGVAILANEPSYAGIYILFFLLITDILFQKKLLSKTRMFIIKALLLFLIFGCTKSGNAFLLFIIYLVLNTLFIYSKYQKIIILILFSAVMIWLFILINELAKNSRIFNLLKILLRNPASIFKDFSIMSRYAFIVISYYGLISSYGLGNGLAAYSFNWEKLARILHYTSVFDIKRNLRVHALLMPFSFIGGIAHDFGIPGLAIILYLVFKPCFSHINASDKKYLYVIILNVFFLWLQTCSYSLPMPWFFLGIAYGLANRKITLTAEL